MNSKHAVYLRELSPTDASFILELVNEDGWKNFIGDRQVYNLENAGKYIQVIRGKFQPEFGYGYFVFENARKEALGIVGLLKRHYLEGPDLGYAILQRFSGNGYTKKACKKLLSIFVEQKHPELIQAIVQANNPSSIHLLKSLNFSNLGEKNINGESLCLFEHTTPHELVKEK